jgi:hypothetical protein
MKHKQKLTTLGLIILALIIGGAVYYAANRSNRCDTSGIRPNDCIPANNRCTPPGDPREATIDCAEFRYYQEANKKAP